MITENILSMIDRYIDLTHNYGPVNVLFELTNSCSFRCAHCYIPNGLKQSGEYIDKKLALRILSELKAYGCIRLIMTGGEALLHPDFDKIYQTAHSLGFEITLFTNGYHISKEALELLIQFPPYAIDISLYGWDDESYYRFTSIKDSYEKVRMNIKKLKEAGLPVSIKASLLKSNISYRKEMINFAKDNGLTLRWDGIIIGSLSNKISNIIDMNRLTPFEVIMSENSEKIEPHIFNYRKMIEASSNEETLLKCGAGKNSFCISATGELLLCSQLRINPYNLSRGTIADGIKYFKPISEQLMPKDMKCKDCKYIDFCRYCPGRFLLENGSLYEPPNWYCEYGKLKFIRNEEHKRV